VQVYRAPSFHCVLHTQDDLRRHVSIERLEALKRLRAANLQYTRVTREGADKLRMALPRAKAAFVETGAAAPVSRHKVEAPDSDDPAAAVKRIGSWEA
jgi:hypothetical protein